MLKTLIVNILRFCLNPTNDVLNMIEKLLPCGERTTSNDYSIFTNIKTTDDLNQLTHLAFLDSRGRKILSEKVTDTLAYKIAQQWTNQHKYLVLTRTHASTTFFTLLNFLKIMNRPLKQLVTNIGFVDFTPKKENVLEDIQLQSQYLFPQIKLHQVACENFEISSGENAMLSYFDLFPLLKKFSDCICAYADSVVLIGTPELPKSLILPRSRPMSFFDQLQMTNDFLLKLEAENKIKIIFYKPQLDTNEYAWVFDGVHYAAELHSKIFQDLTKLRIF